LLWLLVNSGIRRLHSSADRVGVHCNESSIELLL